MTQAAAVQVRPVTADEFYQIPDDGLRRELVDGEVRIMSPPATTMATSRCRSDGDWHRM